MERAIDMKPRHLSGLLESAADRHPDRIAIEDESGRCWTFAELHHRVARLADHWRESGIGRGDRVGLALPKSIEAVAAIHAILRVGAAYVPVDFSAPPARSAGIFHSAGVKAIVGSPESAERLKCAWPQSGALPDILAVGDQEWDRILERTPASDPGFAAVERDPADLAYVLYTSGSTGTPKGVMLSHANAFTFLDWCFEAFALSPEDRFSSHAPFHFDLSVFDLYASCRAMGTLVLIGEALGKEPQRLGAFLRERRISVWYSAPSILTLLSEFGGAGEEEFPAPRLVLFAGEVFPIGKLKRLRRQWPSSEMWNLYGPTETNVCTAYRVPDSVEAVEARTGPLPIGLVCPPLRAKSEDGELLIAGPGVMQGYFGRPDLTETAFRIDESGERWYRTGDLVSETAEGFIYRGRRDRMIKRRGYRIELGEIEAALYRFEGAERCAVIASADDDAIAIIAFVVLGADRKPSQIAVKRHCSLHLPSYMIPDSIVFLPKLPMTSTDKVDYQELARLAARS